MPTRVLLLEEDATYARELLHGLSEAGIEVTLARDGDAGLARAVAERFDALVVSAELPGINGFRLCGKLRRDPTFVSPIVLMGSERTIGFEEHQKLPTRANQYLRKPVVVAELVAVLERLRAEAAVRPMTRPPPMARGRSGSLSDASAATALAAALERANAQSSLVAQLRKQLEERDQQVVSMTRELGDTKRKLHIPSDDAALRDQVHKKERELAEIRSSFDAEHHTLLDLQRAHAALEAKASEAERTLAELRERAAQAENVAKIAKSEREAANRRADDYGRRAERQRGELEKTKAELEKATAALAASDERTEQLRHALAGLQADVDGAGERTKQAEAELHGEMERLRARAEQAELALREAHFERDSEHENRERLKEQLAEALAAAAAEKAARSAAEARAAQGRQAETEAQQAKRARAEAEERLSQQLAAARADGEREGSALRERIQALEATETELRAALARERDRHAEELSRTEERYVRHMTDVQAEQRARDAALAQAQAARQAAEEHATEAEQVLASLEERLEREKAQRTHVTDDALNRLSEERAAARTRTERLAAQLRSSEARVVELTTSLTRAHAERDHAVGDAKQDVTAARDELAATQRAAQLLENRHAQLADEHAKAQEAVEKLNARMLQLEASLASAQEAQGASQRIKDAADSMRSQLQSAVAGLERKLAAVTTARDEATRQLAAAVAERDEAREETSRVRARSREKSDEAAQRIADTQAKERLAHARGRELEQALRERLSAMQNEIAELRASQPAGTSAEASASDMVTREEAERALAAQEARMRSEAAATIAAIRAPLEAQVRALETQGVELSKALARSRENLDAERRNRLEEEGQLMAQIDGLEALSASQAARIAELERHLGQAPGQSSTLQQQLDEAKQKLEHETAATRAALEQIERDRTLIDQAQTVLAELVGDDEDDDKTSF